MSREQTTVQTVLGEWIELERQVRGQSLTEVAQRLGIALATLVTARQRGRFRFLQRRVREALGRYLRLDAEMVGVLFGIPLDGEMRTQHVYVTTDGRLTRLGQVLDQMRARRNQTEPEQAAAIGLNARTLWELRLRERVRGHHARTWARVAAYVGTSVADAQEWAEADAVELEFPVESWIGRKLHPTVRPQNQDGGGSACDGCVFRPGCEAEVAAGDFAWCEDVIAEDFMAGKPEVERSYEGWW